MATYRRLICPIISARLGTIFWLLCHKGNTHREIIAQLGQVIVAVLFDYTLDFLVVVLQRLVTPPLSEVPVLIVSATLRRIA